MTAGQLVTKDDVRYPRFNIPPLRHLLAAAAVPILVAVAAAARFRENDDRRERRERERERGRRLDTCQKLDSNPVGALECRTTGGRGGESRRTRRSPLSPIDVSV